MKMFCLFLSMMMVHQATSSRECCSTMEISSNTMSISGSFKNSGVWSDKPVYWSQTHNLFLYFLPMRVGGLWTIGPHIGELGLLGHLGLDDCPQDLESSAWKYRVGTSWFLDQNIKMDCLDQQKVHRDFHF